MRLTAPYDAYPEFEPAAGSPKGGVASLPAEYGKVGRNDPCPCGRGKKYKKCCLRAAEGAHEQARRGANVHETDERVVWHLCEFAIDRYGPKWHAAIQRFKKAAGSDDPMLVQLCGPWSVYEACVDGERPVDAFLADHAASLSPEERAWLAAQTRASLSIWEVVSCEPGVSVTVQGRFSGERSTVREVRGSRDLVARDTVLARVVDCEGASYFGKSPYTLLAGQFCSRLVVAIQQSSSPTRAKRCMYSRPWRSERPGRARDRRGRAQNSSAIAAIGVLLHACGGRADLSSPRQLSTGQPSDEPSPSSNAQAADGGGPSSCNDGIQPDSGSASFGLGPQHRGRSNLRGPRRARVALTRPVIAYSYPVVMSDGSLLLFARHDESIQGPMLLSFDVTGRDRWSVSLGTPGDSSPALVNGTSIVFGTLSGLVRSFGVGGDARFMMLLKQPVFSSAALHSGTAYIGSGDGIVAFDATLGTIRWNALRGVKVTASPAVAEDGTIIVFGEDDVVHALSPTGTELWHVLIGNESGPGSDYPSPAIRNDGVILVGGKVSRLTAISPDGQMLWTARARGPSVWSTAAVATDGTAYWSESDPIGTALHATNADGSPKWSVSVANRILGRGGGAAVIDRDGIVYFSAFQGDTVAVDPLTGSVLWKIDGVYDGGGGTIALGIGRHAYVIGTSTGDSLRVIEDASCAP